MKGRPWYRAPGDTVGTFDEQQKAGNRKTTDGKVPTQCLPLDAMTGVAWVFKHGEVKYGPENWRQPLPGGDDVRHYLAAAVRHLAACWTDHAAQDKESGASHIDHAIASLIIASHHQKARK